MDANEVRQVLLDAIAENVPKIGVGASTGEALRNLAEAWVLLNQGGSESLGEGANVPHRVR